MTLFQHSDDHYVTENLNEIHDESLTPGERVADGVANTIGSWRFVITQSLLLLIWIVLNSVPWFRFKWDAYPYILLNLMLSFQAAYTAPAILMSQNRQASKDRMAAEHDYQVNLKNETRLIETHRHLDEQDGKIIEILEKSLEILERIERKS